jgi:hypothetical protein
LRLFHSGSANALNHAGNFQYSKNRSGEQLTITSSWAGSGVF